eukprot:4552093-Prymnesium_polylepis.1
MEEPAADDDSAINSLTGAMLATLRGLAVRRLCDALSSEHCALLELSLQDFGFTPDSVLQLAEPLRGPACSITSLLLGEWPMN